MNAGDVHLGIARTLPRPNNSAFVIVPMSCFRGATKVLDFFTGSGVKVAPTRASRVISEGCVGITGIYVFVRIEEALRCIEGALRRKTDKRTPTQE